VLIGDATAARVGFVVGQDVVDDVQGAAGVQDGAPAAPAAESAAAAPAVGDGQAGDGDGEPLVDDVEHPERVAAADGQLVRPRPLDVQALLDRQFVAGQGDGLTVEAGCEDDRVAAVDGGDGRPQGP